MSPKIVAFDNRLSYRSLQFQLPTSEFWLQTSDFWVPTLHFALPSSEFQLRTLNFPLKTSEFWVPTSDFRVSISEFRLPSSNFWVPTSPLRLPSSDFRVPTSEFWLLSFHFRLHFWRFMLLHVKGQVEYTMHNLFVMFSFSLNGYSLPECLPDESVVLNVISVLRNSTRENTGDYGTELRKTQG